MIEIATIATSLLFTQCINNIVELNSANNDLIFLRSDRTFSFPLVRINLSESYEDSPRAQFYIFENYDDLELVYFLATIRFEDDNRRYNAHAKLIIFGYDFSEHLVDFVVWLKLYRVIFVAIETREIYSVFPYKNFSLNNVNIKMELVGNCDNLNNQLFPADIPRNWTQSNVSIVYHVNPVYINCINCKKPGILIEILQILLNYWNVQADYINYDNYLVEAVVDIHIGTISPDYSHRNPVFETSMPVLQEPIAFFVPKSAKWPRWRHILSVYDKTSLVCFILSFVIISLLWLSITQLFSSHKFQVAFNDFVSKKRFDISTSYKYSQNILVASSVFLTFMMTSLFNSRLTYLLNGINYDTSIETHQDIINNKLNIGTSSPWLDLRLGIFPEFTKHLEKHFINCYDPFECYRLISIGKHTASLQLSRQFRNVIWEKYPGVNGMKELKPYALLALVTVDFAKGHPLFELFQKDVQSLIESGIVTRIVKKYDVAVELEDEILERRHKLSLEQIFGPACFLCIGSMVGFMIFVCEMFKFKKPTKLFIRCN